MDFRTILNKMDVLTESLTLTGLIAATTGYEQDDSIRYPIIAKLARSNGFAGLVDPTKGLFIPADWEELGDEEDEVPMASVKQLSAAGLLPQGSKLPQAGWFDDNDVYDAANAHWNNQNQQAMAKQARRSKLLAEYARIKAEIYRIAKEAGVDPQTATATNTQPPTTRPTSQPNLATTTLGSSSMNDYAKNKITPDMTSLSEAIIRSMVNEDFKDFDPEAAWAAAKGAYQGASFGLAPDINAGVKSLVKGTRYKDELPSEVERFRKAEREYPRAYTGGEVAGAMAGPGKFMSIGKGLGTAAAAMGGQAAVRAGYGANIPDEPTTQTGADAKPDTNLDPAQVSQSVQAFQEALNMQFGEKIPANGEINPETVEVIKKHILSKYGEQQ